MVTHLFDSATESIVCNNLFFLSGEVQKSKSWSVICLTVQLNLLCVIIFFSTNYVLNTLYFIPFFMRLVIRKLFWYEDSFKTIFQLIDEELETYYRLIYFKPINYAHLRKS